MTVGWDYQSRVAKGGEGTHIPAWSVLGEMLYPAETAEASIVEQYLLNKLKFRDAE